MRGPGLTWRQALAREVILFSIKLNLKSNASSKAIIYFFKHPVKLNLYSIGASNDDIDQILFIICPRAGERGVRH